MDAFKNRCDTCRGGECSYCDAHRLWNPNDIYLHMATQNQKIVQLSTQLEQQAKDDTSGIGLIAKERERQINQEGWTAKHDQQHSDGELTKAAVCYATSDDRRIKFDDGTPHFWPWHPMWWKPTPDDRIKELVKAGALIAAEIDRLRAEGDER